MDVYKYVKNAIVVEFIWMYIGCTFHTYSGLKQLRAVSIYKSDGPSLNTAKTYCKLCACVCMCVSLPVLVFQAGQCSLQLLFVVAIQVGEKVRPRWTVMF